MVKAIVRILMVCASRNHCRSFFSFPLVSFSNYSVLRDLYNTNCMECRNQLENTHRRVIRRFDEAPKHFPAALLCSPMGFPIDSFESVVPNFQQSRFFSSFVILLQPLPYEWYARLSGPRAFRSFTRYVLFLSLNIIRVMLAFCLQAHAEFYKNSKNLSQFILCNCTLKLRRRHTRTKWRNKIEILPSSKWKIPTIATMV